MNYNKHFFLAITLLLLSVIPSHAKTIRALFLGNSYTQVNNLPALIANLASTNGDTLIYSSNTPGGQTLWGHSTNSTSLNLIAQGGWDFVILQEQSQLPAFSDDEVSQSVYPYAIYLDSLIHVSNPCAQTLFYMTWGRKNGDAGNCPYFPPICTYEGMDNLLQLRYSNMAAMTNGVISPVAKVWRALRLHHPGIELYSGDESHPSVAGSFAGACTFYSFMFKKNPVNSDFNSGLTPDQAATIKAVAAEVAYDSLDYWYRFQLKPNALFSFMQLDSSLTFINGSTNASTFLWDFGNNDTSMQKEPTYIYNKSGNYTIRLIALDQCGNSDTAFTNALIELENEDTTGSLGISTLNTATAVSIFPNPIIHELTIVGTSPLADIRISDMYGKVVFQQSLNQSYQSTINLSVLAPGIYWIWVHNQPYRITKVD
ncbi:MAG: PKD domain-containing protein [Bacteroidia bacterium]|nr:PKD domain-containing protein [Bacteroidia bacterium]